jgi:3'5'-cyclic nucleotide phosphodiesterase
MSVLKLLGRAGGTTDRTEQVCDISQFYLSDPLVQFGCVLSALVHDIDHQGVSNMQLVKEGAVIATHYNNKSVAEQNAIDIGWSVFKADEYSEFRKAVCPSAHQLQRLRQLVVNSVIATDIIDADLQKDRNSRWETAFCDVSSSDIESQENACRRATLIIEHMIQASDVSHCMQHWTVYRKWNERLFREMYRSYIKHRTARDPTEFWYQGELAFFDFYIIPLAKKLRDCKAFGVSSDEFLNYAEQNREEWRRRGEEIIPEMALRARKNI